MEKEILEGDKLIAKFDGWKFLPNGNCWHERFNDHGQQIEMTPNILSQYHTSWDWLMPVVDKIESINECSYKVMLHYSIGFISDNSLHGNPIILRNTGFTRIETAYNLVVKFIEWYNSTKKS